MSKLTTSFVIAGAVIGFYYIGKYACQKALAKKVAKEPEAKPAQAPVVEQQPAAEEKPVAEPVVEAEPVEQPVTEPTVVSEPVDQVVEEQPVVVEGTVEPVLPVVEEPVAEEPVVAEPTPAATTEPDAKFEARLSKTWFDQQFIKSGRKVKWDPEWVVDNDYQDALFHRMPEGTKKFHSTSSTGTKLIWTRELGGKEIDTEYPVILFWDKSIGKLCVSFFHNVAKEPRCFEFDTFASVKKFLTPIES